MLLDDATLLLGEPPLVEGAPGAGAARLQHPPLVPRRRHLP
jgi:hypothetical protein